MRGDFIGSIIIVMSCVQSYFGVGCVQHPPIDKFVDAAESEALTGLSCVKQPLTDPSVFVAHNSSSGLCFLCTGGMLSSSTASQPGNDDPTMACGHTTGFVFLCNCGTPTDAS